ncbi:MAG TPA: metalloregulator ArsR/SmtB family transcription factor [Polyangiaceae bacterium LLY-WYZ-15_(1-7)]|nr:metalloregulator ArsR/SmtB family transcription factor [Polyangiaceae bacterium LLY-WYZ-15_(1-7)]HJL10307.1 metalloregulator ArsR/SmtB family transcription factor [Polyangiaceae bacterium LLY-WYZ-15_(1-7)]HJL34717.1 metalloregulator ArsR/SmtB family transcription factor [Polyangiaceae bacterium LLY-WYZ-15_(1-7)]
MKDDADELDCHDEAHPTVDHAPIPADVLERAASMFRAAGDPGRLRILHCLLCGEHCVSDLAAEFDEGMSTISQRLKVLRTEGLVHRRREGKHIYYTLADDHVAELVRGAIDHAGHDH